MRTDTPSGYPVPRIVSLKFDETNCRIGPSGEHPVRFVFRRAGAPVMVVAESVDHWRKIRDSAGDECWAHRVTLRAQTHVLTIDETTLFRKASVASGASAELARGVLARIEARKGEWLKLSAVRADGKRAGGWTESATVWGGAIASPVPGPAAGN
ncbi:MAG: SH3 domain-containing protein [Parvularculaceae bacterium]